MKEKEIELFGNGWTVSMMLDIENIKGNVPRDWIPEHVLDKLPLTKDNERGFPGDVVFDRLGYKRRIDWNWHKGYWVPASLGVDRRSLPTKDQDVVGVLKVSDCYKHACNVPKREK